MSTYPANSFHKAVFQKLNTHAPLTLAVSGIYDRVITGAAFPYLVLDAVEISQWDTLSSQGYRCEIALDIYSRQGGRKELTQIIDIVYSLLHNQTLTIELFSVATLEVIRQQTQYESDAITSSARLIVRSYIQETEAA